MVAFERSLGHSNLRGGNGLSLPIFVVGGITALLLLLQVSMLINASRNNGNDNTPGDQAMLNGAGDNVAVEDLMYLYKSDKSRDDHGYTKLYDMIFSPIRHTVTNVTEIGIAAGQSLQAWYRYFPNAEIHGFDLRWFSDSVKRNLDLLAPRVRPHIFDILSDTNSLIGDLGFLPESMDIIIEDGPHEVNTQMKFLVKMFPFLKPGGYYIIEDIGSGQRGPEYFHEKPEELLTPESREILESNDAMWVDTALGHRAWPEWVRRVGVMWAANHTYHNSYTIVIKKRERPLKEPMQMNYKNGAMDPNSALSENVGRRR